MFFIIDQKILWKISRFRHSSILLFSHIFLVLPSKDIDFPEGRVHLIRLGKTVDKSPSPSILDLCESFKVWSLRAFKKAQKGNQKKKKEKNGVSFKSGLV